MTQLAREKMLYQYISAVESGDFDIVTSILYQAEQDSELEQMIMGINEALGEEFDEGVHRETVRLVRQLTEKHLPSGIFNSDDEIHVPPILLSDVASRLMSNAAVPAHARKEIKSITRQLSQTEASLPTRFNQRTIGLLLAELGLSASSSFKRLFHETAVLLSMGREQNLAQLAATRRQRNVLNRKNEKGDSKE